MSIALVLVVLVVSLMLTALMEMVEAWFKTRAADLDRAIRLMLGEPAGNADVLVNEFYKRPLVYSLFEGEYEKPGKSVMFDPPIGNTLPLYIPRDISSTVAMDLAAAGGAGKHVEEKARALPGGAISSRNASVTACISNCRTSIFNRCRQCPASENHDEPEQLSSMNREHDHRCGDSPYVNEKAPRLWLGGHVSLPVRFPRQFVGVGGSPAHSVYSRQFLLPEDLSSAARGYCSSVHHKLKYFAGRGTSR
ncbi:hypothetical protein [Ancylobacter sp. FA202]|uniref:hypothetical protein n=1 Tax=Ancylobacter sp. FA202 TaxID=1111106 RepID=UPI0012DC6D68|nr:hypothetical protein [Ancylobacter sp. FA202]